jgi:hypothetical protein
MKKLKPMSKPGYPPLPIPIYWFIFFQSQMLKDNGQSMRHFSMHECAIEPRNTINAAVGANRFSRHEPTLIQNLHRSGFMSGFANAACFT